MPALTSDVFVANHLARQDLVNSMFEGKAITIKNVHGIVGNDVKGIVNALQHEDGSGSSFNVTIGKQTIHTRTTDKPKAFGLNYNHVADALTYRDAAPTRQELMDSFLEGKPVIGKFSLKGEQLVLAGHVTGIQREDGSGQSFNIILNQGTRVYVRTRD